MSIPLLMGLHLMSACLSLDHSAVFSMDPSSNPFIGYFSVVASRPRAFQAKVQDEPGPSSE